MKDIYTILGEIGLTVPEEKKPHLIPQSVRIIKRYQSMTRRAKAKRNAVSDVPS